ncbi:inorganic phosphate transporter [bacterium]|nr:inorganic phosphate transporter [bacterium]MCI0606225.1 inorganic phosphate transporter [bacterium]
MEWGLILVLLLILGAEFVNGWTDAPNSMATVVSTRALPPIIALVMATIFNLAGVLLSGTAVAKTIGTGIVNPDVINLTTVASAMLGIIIWSSVAAYWGLPTSESHALVAGLAGAGLAAAGPDALLWVGWKKVLIGLVFSTFIGFGGGFLIMMVIYRIFRKVNHSRVRGLFRYLQVFSCAFMAFSHGTNDGQKFMGVFTLALVLAGVFSEFVIPLWVVLICAITMAIGTMTGGWKIMKTMGMRMTHLDTPQGFSAELGAATTIEIATRLGIPVSTTHTINTSIMGVGAVRRFSAVRWGVSGEIITAWVLTFPVCGTIAFLVTKFVQLIKLAF